MEDPANDDDVILDAVDGEMAGATHHARPGAAAAAAQVPGAHAVTELGALGATGPGRGRGDVADAGGDQLLVALACLLAELVLGPGEDVDDVGPGSVRDPVPGHCRDDAILAAAGVPNWPMKSSRSSSPRSV